MRSLRTRITLMTVFVLIVTVVIMSVISVIFIKNNEQNKSDQLMLLMCETGVSNLDFYFNGTQKSVEKVASYAETDLNGLTEEALGEHVGHVKEYFKNIAERTGGVLTYYYRIDPAVSDTIKGFWYTDLDQEGFTEHEVTDITQYDTSDTTKLVWFTVPKYEGKAIWLPPYITDNLDKRVISYNVPVYYNEQFVGVIGIEIQLTVLKTLPVFITHPLIFHGYNACRRILFRFLNISGEKQLTEDPVSFQNTCLYLVIDINHYILHAVRCL